MCANGRTQMMLDMVAYAMRQPVEEALNTNSVTLIMDYKTVMRSGTAEAKQAAQESVTAFQQQAGLDVDGAFGRCIHWQELARCERALQD